MFGTECWAASVIKTAGPEKLFAFALSLLLMCTYPSDLHVYFHLKFCFLISVFFLVAFCRYGAHGLTLSKIVPHICHLLGDPTSQVSVFLHIYRLFYSFQFHEISGIVVLWSVAPPAGDHRNCDWH